MYIKSIYIEAPQDAVCSVIPLLPAFSVHIISLASRYKVPPIYLFSINVREYILILKIISLKTFV
jgi:hypothetical protein